MHIVSTAVTVAVILLGIELRPLVALGRTPATSALPGPAPLQPFASPLALAPARADMGHARQACHSVFHVEAPLASRQLARRGLMICCCLTFAGLLIVVRGVLATFAVDPADLLTASDLVGQGNDTHIKAAQRAPKIMHQVWLSDVDEPMPARWRAASASCRTQHPDYEYRYWTTSTARSFVAEHYAPYLGVYDSYHYRIQRADAFRYFVLHRLGGVYLDIDVQCRRSLDPLLAYDFVAPATYPFGVGNDVIVASPRHDLLAQVIEALPRTAHTYGTQYTTVLLSTGPLLLSALVAGFHDRRAAGVRILAPRLYGKHARGDPGALFVHHFASSWHGGDVVVCSWLCRCLLAGLLIVARASHVRTARCVAQKLWTSDRRLWHDFEDGSEMPLLTDRDDGVP